MFHLIKNLEAELRATAETVARDTFFKKVSSYFKSYAFEGRKEISSALSSRSMLVVTSTEHPFCQAISSCLFL